MGTWKTTTDNGSNEIATNLVGIAPETLLPTSTLSSSDFPWASPDAGWDASLISLEALVSENPVVQGHGLQEAPHSATIPPLPEGNDIALFPEILAISLGGQAIESLDKDPSSSPRQTCDWPQSDSRLPSLIPSKSLLRPNIATPMSPSCYLRQQEDDLTTTTTSVIATETPNQLAAEESSTIPDTEVRLLSGRELETERQIAIRLKTPRRTTISVASLRKRLSNATDKYSHSTLEDIVSLMEHCTISTSSSASTAPSRWSQVPTSTYLPTLEEDVRLQPSAEHPVVFPGALPEYCWEQILNNKLIRCNKGHKYRKMRICRHMGRRLDQSTKYRFSQYKVYVGPKGGKVDVFSNSALHIAAALTSSPTLLMSLIRAEISVHTLNTAGQTFLHLIHPECTDLCLEKEYIHESDFDICMLLKELKDRGFNFLQQDHNGRTSLHWLTRPEIPRSDLLKIIKTIRELQIPLPTLRDNSGYTVAGQLKCLGVLDPDEESKFRQNFCPVEVPLALDAYIHNYEKTSLIQTVDDLQRYAYHADLLKTINTSRKNPHFEDSSGRNGLHCLAEVAFDLVPSTSHSGPTYPLSDRYLYNTELNRNMTFLLEAGVDPNSYDKHGLTPLMAFIIHMRPGPQDSSATWPLQQLIESGADINRRNRQGLTALHLAVQLGRRAATGFLINVGANVHARAGNGLGVVALGHKYAHEAKHNVSLYAQITLCVALAGGAGAVSAPTILGEWAMKSLVEYPVDERHMI